VSTPEPDIADVSGRVYIAVVLGTTFRASPIPYNELAHTRVARWGSTEAAGSRCVSYAEICIAGGSPILDILE